MKFRCGVIAVAVALFAGVSGRASELPSANQPVPELTYSGGWLGADAGYSLPLAPGKSLWLFGDTFVGDPQQTQRTKSKTMVRNSVGITECDGRHPCTVKYFWKDPQAAKPRSFFDTGKDDLWYWPMDVVLDNGVLYVALSRVRNLPNAKPDDAFGFEVAGTSLATVTNPLDPPEKWNVTYQPLTNSNVWPGVTIVPDGDYIYFFTAINQGKEPSFMALLRVARDKVGHPNRSWEYWAKDKQWHPGFKKDDAFCLIDPAASEMTVRFHPDIKKWVAVSSGPEFPTHRIVVRKADALTGPWSAPETVYTIPEMKAGTPGFDKDTFCYAGKEHIEFAADAKLLVTYACNSFDFRKMLNNMDIYRIKAVLVNIPK